ncbi:MAG: hypothetical protein ACEROO_12500 [Candidatus Bathyarchaeota archaeon]|jgi:hypothetical protein
MSDKTTIQIDKKLRSVLDDVKNQISGLENERFNYNDIVYRSLHFREVALILATYLQEVNTQFNPYNILAWYFDTFQKTIDSDVLSAYNQIIAESSSRTRGMKQFTGGENE